MPYSEKTIRTTNFKSENRTIDCESTILYIPKTACAFATPKTDSKVKTAARKFGHLPTLSASYFLVFPFTLVVGVGSWFGSCMTILFMMHVFLHYLLVSLA